MHLLLTLYLATISTTKPAQTIAPPPQAAGYQMAFSDEFDTLDLSKDGKGVHNWYMGVWFEPKPAPVANYSDASSTLRLDWTKGQAVGDTSMTTLSKDMKTYKAWTYGYFEARMKWDVVKGAWPAFWMIPIEDANRTDVYNGVRESGEIDIFEGIGDSPKTFYGTLHDWVNNKDHSSNPNYFPIPSGALFSDYHVYGLLWTPGKVTWYFDNNPIGSASTSSIFDKQHYYLVLGMQEGVNWSEGSTTGVTANKMSLYVDYVRVWQK